MPIKNYTTKVDVHKTLGEIHGCLASHGARKVMFDYDEEISMAIYTISASGGYGRTAIGSLQGKSIKLWKGNGGHGLMEDFENRKKLVLTHCPRGKEYYCDGTPNKSIEGWKGRKDIGKCQHRKKGKCTYLEKMKRR